MYDDDALDRALAALPLEQPPADLHARIMAATAYAPAPAAAAPLPGWELWLAAVLSSLALWLAWVFVSTPHVVDQLAASVDRLVTGVDLASASASVVVWVAVGVSAAWWITQLSVPQPERIRLRR